MQKSCKHMQDFLYNNIYSVEKLWTDRGKYLKIRVKYAFLIYAKVK
jgi:hypothetical protein